MSFLRLPWAAVLQVTVVPYFAAAVLLAGGCSQSREPGAGSEPRLRVDTEQSLRAAHIAAVQREADASYEAWEATGEVLARNAAHKLRFQLSERGLRVQPDRASSWQAELSLLRTGCSDQMQAVSAARPQARGNRVEYQREGLREWYVNGPLGLEQGFDVERKPGCAEGEGLLLELALTGDLTLREQAVDGIGTQLAFADPGGRPALRFGDLYAFDADGRTLPAFLEAAGTRVTLRVDDRGARYPVTVDPLMAHQQGLLAPADGKKNDGFGYSVAFSGDTALVGAWSADLPGLLDAGAAYVYVRNGGFWTQQAKLTAADASLGGSFGNTVALDGDTAVISAVGATAGGKDQAGAVYVFTRAGTAWTQQAKLVAPDADTKTFFGTGLSVQGDTAVIGADWASHSGIVQAGAVYVFVRTGTAWTQQAKLVASDAATQAYFGNSISFDGQTALIGAYYMPLPGKPLAGAAYVFVRTGTTWAQQAKLVAADASGGENFGISVSLRADTALIGAYRANAGGKSAAGAAYVFVRAGAAWTQQAKLTGSAPDTSAEFGRSVAVAGDVAIVGAPFPNYVAIPGYAYVFTREGTTWAEQIRVVPPSLDGLDRFGIAVALSGDTFIVGADLGDSPAVLDTGSAYAERIANGKLDGTSCEADAECESGHCVDLVCCNTACGNGNNGDCMACNTAKGASKNGVCGVVAKGEICRFAAGDCDLNDVCDGTSLACPTDVFKPAAIVCRAVAGNCDVAENCTGTSPVCPVDTFKPTTTECRAKADVCDQAEFCTGTAAVCPANTYLPATTECRPEAAVCDKAEFCTGISQACPGNSFKPSSTVCRPAAGDCDKEERCTGSNQNCPVDSFTAKNTICRAAAGDCDAAESCTGTSASCPADAFLPSSHFCRFALGVCDAAESCTGTSASCPDDAMRPKDTECRPAAGSCDSAESCTGSQPDCPADAFKSSTTVCRPSAGSCDVAESCSGSSADCPGDEFQTSAVQCRPSAEPGDPAEFCAGTSAECPRDVPKTPSIDPGTSTGCQIGLGTRRQPAPAGLWLCGLGLVLLLRRRATARPN